MLYSRNQHEPVKQLYSNYKKIKLECIKKNQQKLLLIAASTANPLALKLCFIHAISYLASQCYHHWLSSHFEIPSGLAKVFPNLHPYQKASTYTYISMTPHNWSRRAYLSFSLLKFPRLQGKFKSCFVKCLFSLYVEVFLLWIHTYLLLHSSLFFSCGLPLNWIPSLILPTIFWCLNVIHLKAVRLCRSQRSQKLPNNWCEANSIQYPNIGSEAQYRHVEITEMNLNVSAASKWRPVSIWLHVLNKCMFLS